LQQGEPKMPGGLQAVPRPRKMRLGPLHCWGKRMKQLEPQQQAPRQLAPAMHTGTTTPPCCWHWAAVAMLTQLPLVRQQATVVGWHGLGEQVGVPGLVVPGGHGPWKKKHAVRSQHGCGGQLLGVQVLPGAPVVPAGHGPRTMMHDPSLRQQARTHGLGWQLVVPGLVVPCGHGPWKKKHDAASQHGWPGQVLGVQVLPGAGIDVVGQRPVTMKHEPSDRQHACGHGLGLQVVLLMIVPLQVVPSAIRMQLPSARQQARGGQGLGLHAVPRPMKTLGEVHWAATVMKQKPSMRQHAPKQRVGVQAVPGPNQVPGAPVGLMQPAWVVMMHWPLARQQAPRQESVVQVVPTPRNRLGGGQLPTGVMMH